MFRYTETVGTLELISCTALYKISSYWRKKKNKESPQGKCTRKTSSIFRQHNSRKGPILTSKSILFGITKIGIYFKQNIPPNNSAFSYPVSDRIFEWIMNMHQASFQTILIRVPVTTKNILRFQLKFGCPTLACVQFRSSLPSRQSRLPSHTQRRYRGKTFGSLS